MTTVNSKMNQILRRMKSKKYSHSTLHSTLEELLTLMNKDKVSFLASATTLKRTSKTRHESQIRRPDIVLKYGQQLLNESNESKMTPSKYWELYEIVGIAALDCGEEKVANACFEKLRNKFGKESARVQRLIGMELESKRKYGEAKKLYESILTENPSNQLVKKRLISINVANGKIKEAIKLLVDHIKLCATDVLAWQQLANLYIAVHCFRHASFCYEELITINPRELLYHQMYAELKYTVGRNKIDDLVLSRQYFAMAVDVQPKSARALIGMAMSAKAVAEANKKSKKLSDEEMKLNQKVHSFAVSKLKEMYAQDKTSSILSGYMERVLKL